MLSTLAMPLSNGRPREVVRECEIADLGRLLPVEHVELMAEQGPQLYAADCSAVLPTLAPGLRKACPQVVLKLAGDGHLAS